MDGDSNGFGGASEGPDPAGDYSGGSDYSGGGDYGAPGTSAPGVNGSPGVASSGSGLSLAGAGLGLAAAPGPGLSLGAATGAPGLAISAPAVADFSTGVNVPGLDAGTAASVAAASAALAMNASAAASVAAAEQAAKAAALEKAGRLALNTVPGAGLVVAVVETIAAGIQAFLGGTSAPAGAQATSQAPDLVADTARGAIGAGTSFAGVDGYGSDTVSGSPVLGFAGVQVNQDPASVPAQSGGALQGLSDLVNALARAPATGRAGLVDNPAQPSAPTIPPAVILAGLATLIFGM